MKIVEIYTPSNEKYIVNELGQIIRTDMIFTPSNSWKFKGISHVKKNLFIPFEKLTKELVKELSLRYKNGNPQFTVMDVDHGTVRTWGNTKYNGIASIVIKE